MDTSRAHAWQWMHPPLQCHAHGWLDVGDGHQVYWETGGNPLGAPALFVHGGPGAGCRSDDRRWFDPARFRIVLFDQRGAGRSRPPGRLEHNTTAHLVHDMEALRQHLGIDRWLLFGGSWGATLALAYAQQHPRRVRALVLRGVFLATRRERDWLYTAGGAACGHPAAWQRIRAAIPRTQPADLAAAFSQQLHCGEAAAERAAAQAWLRWEQDLMDAEAVLPQPSPRPCLRETPDDSQALAMARIGVHFARHGYFLDEGQLLADADRLREIPGAIVQGQRDRVTPPAAAQALHRAWPESRIFLISTAGHASSHGAMAQHLVAATDRFGQAEAGAARAALATLPTRHAQPKETRDEPDDLFFGESALLHVRHSPG